MTDLSASSKKRKRDRDGSQTRSVTLRTVSTEGSALGPALGMWLLDFKPRSTQGYKVVYALNFHLSHLSRHYSSFKHWLSSL